MSKPLPLPKIEIVEGISVINDTEIGSKYRIALPMAQTAQNANQECFFATDSGGASQLAMAKACADLGHKLTLLYTKRPRHEFNAPMLAAEKQYGAKIKIVDTEDFETVKATAQQIAAQENGKFISFDGAEAVRAIAQTADRLSIRPDFVWCASAYGGIARGLQSAWKNASHFVVSTVRPVGADHGFATVIIEPSIYGTPVTKNPPFKCNNNFEAKAWWQMKQWVEDREERTGETLRPQQIVFWNPANE